MSGAPSVAVVVAVRDGEATIRECVESLLGLRYPADRLELAIVDNGSTDGTRDALSAFGNRITLLREPRRGAGAARNAGIRACDADVIAFTDADCVVEPEWLGGLVAPLADPAVGIVGGRILALEPANRVERFGEVIHDHRRAIEDDDPPYAITMNWASPRRVLQELGGFDPGFLRGQDVDLAYRAVQAGYRIEYAAAAIVRHRNESTLRGLAGEGFVHGFHGVHLRKRHAEFLRSRGHGRGGPPRLRRIGAGLLAWARGRASPAERCETAFSAGKKAGRLLGSARFGRLDP